MTLSQEDGKLFYKLWLPLLDYVNSKCNINDLRNIAVAKELDPQKVKEVANYLWSNVDIIDEYLNDNESDSLTDDDKDIIASWKRCITGRFMMERHLKKGTIFISMETEKVYRTVGIISSWEEMFFGAPMPIMVEATFLPFRDVIISDGLVMPFNIIIGGGMKRVFKDIYMNAKQNGMIHDTL